MCKAIIQHRDGGLFDLALHYCQLPEPPRVFQIEDIGTAMKDRVEAEKRAQAKYAHHDCAKRFGCSLAWEVRQPKPHKAKELGFFERVTKQQS